MGLVCSPATLTCEYSAQDLPAVPLDAPPDAPAYPANDTPANATDVSMGGTFVANLNNAMDDAPQNACGGEGGADVFYVMNLPAAEVIYLDTFGSDFATVIRVFPGKACTDLGNAQSQPPCSRQACGGGQSQMALQLPAGTTCIAVDQKAGESGGALTLTVKRGGRTGTRLPSGMQTLTGNTCDGKDDSDAPSACDGSTGAKDLSYYFTACPNQTVKLDASTCADPTMTSFDTVVYVRPLGMAALACNDDGASCAARPDRPDHPDGSIISTQATGVDLYWLTVDGYSGACGTYQLVTNLR